MGKTHIVLEKYVKFRKKYSITIANLQQNNHLFGVVASDNIPLFRFFVPLHLEEHKVLRQYENKYKLTLLHFSFVYLHPVSSQYLYELGELSFDVIIVQNH